MRVDHVIGFVAVGTREIKAIGEGPPRAMTQSDQDPDYERRRKVPTWNLLSYSLLDPMQHRGLHR